MKIKHLGLVALSSLILLSAASCKDDVVDTVDKGQSKMASSTVQSISSSAASSVASSLTSSVTSSATSSAASSTASSKASTAVSSKTLSIVSSKVSALADELRSTKSSVSVSKGSSSRSNSSTVSKKTNSSSSSSSSKADNNSKTEAIDIFNSAYKKTEALKSFKFSETDTMDFGHACYIYYSNIVVNNDTASMSTYDNEGYSEAYYFEDGMVYFDFDDEKVKESATLEDFGLDLVMYDLQGIKSSNIKSISKSSVSNNGKNFTKLDMKVKVSGVNFVQDILDELIWLGYSDASCETVDVTVFINSDGYIEKYCIDTLVSCDDMSIDLNSVLTMDSPGKTFTVEKPDDLDQYQEIDY